MRRCTSSMRNRRKPPGDGTAGAASGRAGKTEKAEPDEKAKSGRKRSLEEKPEAAEAENTEKAGGESSPLFSRREGEEKRTDLSGQSDGKKGKRRAGVRIRADSGNKWGRKRKGKAGKAESRKKRQIEPGTGPGGAGGTKREENGKKREKEGKKERQKASEILFSAKILYRGKFLMYNSKKGKETMKYTIESIKYLFKNFWYIFPFALVPAVFLSFSLDKDAIDRLLTGFFTGKPEVSFVDVFHAISVLNFRSWEAFLSGFAGVILMVLCVALMFVFIEKHMRIGKRTLNGLFSKLNDNLISTTGIALLYTAIYELWALITSALLFFVFLPSNLPIQYIFSVIVFFGMHFVLLYVVSIFYLWLPCLQITGFRAFEALRYSYQLVAPVKMRIILGQWFSITVAEILLALCCIFVPGKIAGFVLATALYAFMTAIFCVRMQVVYFDRAQLERADLKKYYHF